MIQRLVVPEDVVVVPVADLAEEVRAKFEFNDGDYAISRPHGRASSKIVDAGSAELLNYFRKPISVVDGVIAYSNSRGADPQVVLESAFPVLKRLLSEGLLVPEDSEDANAISAQLLKGDRVGIFELNARMQLLEDTEVYRARDASGREAVVKIARRAGEASINKTLAREARILARLKGVDTPLLYERGDQAGRGYLVMEFVSGITAMAAAKEFRLQRDNAADAMLALCCAIAKAYGQLHARGVIHGDVHPRNLLVKGDVVHLIDFGLSRIEPLEPDFPEPHRGGIGFFFEPEFACTRAGDKAPCATAAGEQYSVGALLYYLITGSYYADFSLERERLLRQIAEAKPLPFVQHGLRPWPELEGVLARALAKDPAARYSSVDEMFEALNGIRASASERELARPSPRTGGASREGAGALFLESMLRRLRSTGNLWREPRPLPAPTCSVNYGAGGVAYLLYRVASLRDEPNLLFDADLWITRALRDCSLPEAFHNQEMGIVRSVVGEVSLFHSVTGLHCVRGLVAQAMGDFGSLSTAIHSFCGAARAPCENIDLTLGRAGLLLGCSALLEATPAPHPFVDALPIRNLGTEIMEGLWRALDALKPIATCTEQPSLGIAHGWGGFLFATLRWCNASDSQVPAGVFRRLNELAACGHEHGRGMRWPRKVRSGQASREGDFAPSWCNGSTGLVHLWLLAYAATGDARYATLAERAGLDSWDCREAYSTLCCGLAGRAYASLALHRATGSDDWLKRADKQVAEAVSCCRADGAETFSLFKGGGGVALVAADLTCPGYSCLPLFDSEG